MRSLVFFVHHLGIFGYVEIKLVTAVLAGLSFEDVFATHSRGFGGRNEQQKNILKTSQQIQLRSSRYSNDLND